jgi:predicted RNase H-like nuclease (RuvC/YqgF family)
LKTTIILMVSLLLVSCSSNAPTEEVLKEEISRLNQELNEVAVEMEQVKQERDQLQEDLNDQKTTDQVNDILIANLAKTLFYDEDVEKTYAIHNKFELVNGWYVYEDTPNITVKGYENAKSVAFKITVPETDVGEVTVSTDNTSSDGWTFHQELTKDFRNVAFWAEITKENGEVIRTPVLPLRRGT